MIQIAVSIGELVDKVTILAIKIDKIRNPAKLVHIRKEQDLLARALARTGITPQDPQFQALKTVNLELWEIEDRIRIKEARQEFDDEFIQLARGVYFANDRRSAIKRAINLAHGSDLMEEKEYVDYGGAPSKG
ncbi:MAG: DUF6165 family protein [Desulfobacterales bacterium]